MGQDLESQKDQGLALEEARPEVKLPPMYRVILINDDYTPMDFVIEILQTFFTMSHDRATQVSGAPDQKEGANDGNTYQVKGAGRRAGSGRRDRPEPYSLSLGRHDVCRHGDG